MIPPISFILCFTLLLVSLSLIDHLRGIKSSMKWGDLVFILQWAHLFGNTPNSPCLSVDWLYCFLRHFKCIALPQGFNRLDTDPLPLTVGVKHTETPRSWLPFPNGLQQIAHMSWCLANTAAFILARCLRLAIAEGVWLKFKLFPHGQCFVAAPFAFSQLPQIFLAPNVFSGSIASFMRCW